MMKRINPPSSDSGPFQRANWKAGLDLGQIVKVDGVYWYLTAREWLGYDKRKKEI